MKVYISVDMEGISGLVRWSDVGPAGIDFERREPICDDMRSNLETMEEFEVEGDQLVRIIAEAIE